MHSHTVEHVYFTSIEFLRLSRFESDAYNVHSVTIICVKISIFPQIQVSYTCVCVMYASGMNRRAHVVQGGPAKVRPTYIFDGNI